MSIFFFATLLYSIYAVMYRKADIFLHSTDKASMEDSHGHFGRLLQAPYPLVLDLSRLFSPEERRRSIQWSLLMSEENENRLIGLSMLHNLEMCPSSSCVVSRPTWCSSASTFILLNDFRSVFCVIENKFDREGVSSCHF